jgi:hypothetical protein
MGIKFQDQLFEMKDQQMALSFEPVLPLSKFFIKDSDLYQSISDQLLNFSRAFIDSRA